MAELKNLIEQIKEKKAEANIDVESLDPRIKSSAGGLQRQAKVELMQLSETYKNEVLKHTVLIAVSGPGAEEFAKISKYAMKTLSVNYLGVVERIAEAIQRRGGAPVFGNHEYLILLSELNQIKVEMGIIRLPTPQFNTFNQKVYGQPNKVALENMFRDAYGEQFFSVAAKREIGRLALEAEFAGKGLPVVLYNNTGDVDSLTLPAVVEAINAPENVNEDFVKTKLSAVKNRGKGSRGKKAEVANNEETENSNE